MRKPRAFSVADDMMFRGLVTKGWSPAAARQYVAEEPFRRRSQRREEGGCRRPVSDSLNSDHVNSVFHATDPIDRSLEADANLLHDPTNPGRKDNV